MARNPFIQRFAVGRTYAIPSSPDNAMGLAGRMTVRAELMPVNQWGNRILLCDVTLDNPPPEVVARHLGARCFVEEGYAAVEDSYGKRTVETEIAALQGIYPYFAKAYATEEAKETMPKSVA